MFDVYLTARLPRFPETFWICMSVMLFLNNILRFAECLVISGRRRTLSQPLPDKFFETADNKNQGTIRVYNSKTSPIRASKIKYSIENTVFLSYNECIFKCKCTTFFRKIQNYSFCFWFHDEKIKIVSFAKNFERTRQ